MNDKIKVSDNKNISKMIYQRLNAVFGLENFLDDEDIDLEELIYEIEDVLVELI